KDAISYKSLTQAYGNSEEQKGGRRILETQDLDDQVLHAHIQNGYIYLQMSKHGVAPFRVRWKEREQEFRFNLHLNLSLRARLQSLFPSTLQL
ncbi:hypothetical protein AMTR_s00210p00013490, partial [Amborella trichopoda]